MARKVKGNIMSYEFGGCRYNNSYEFHDAIAVEFMTAGGLNGTEYIKKEFQERTSKELVDDMISPYGWSDLNDDENFDYDEMIKAMDRLREKYR